MYQVIWNELIKFVLFACIVLSSIPSIVLADDYTWSAQWIWQAADGPTDAFVCFRKTISLPNIPTTAIALIGVDSRYWLWVNGMPVRREAGLKRGPRHGEGYYDSVDISPFLVSGTNTIAVMVWYWGRDRMDVASSGKGGLVFEADCGGTLIKSDNTWKIKTHPAYRGLSSGNTGILWLMAENDVQFDARTDIPSWQANGFDDSGWGTPIEKGVPPIAPWGALTQNPLPSWRWNDLSAYTNSPSFPYTSSGADLIVKLHSNIQFVPYLNVKDAIGGKTITILCQKVANGGTPKHVYITKASNDDQVFEGIAYMTPGGYSEVTYNIPAGIIVKDLKYRETSYDVDFRGSFSCNDSFYNKYWIKARQTAFVNMRDQIMGCPDRERGGWLEDQSSGYEYIPYCFSPDGPDEYRGYRTLIRLCVSNYMNWQHGDGYFPNCAPSAEDPGIGAAVSQNLAWSGEFGLWNYYMQTGDTSIIRDLYVPIKKCLSNWTFNADGCVNDLIGYGMCCGDWMDWGNNIDRRCLMNTQYYSVIKHMADMAVIAGHSDDTTEWNNQKSRIETNFASVFWNEGGFGIGDDRANAWAVCLGLSDSGKYPVLRNVLINNQYCSPQMERYPEEALCLMGYASDALTRLKTRWAVSVNGNSATLGENWNPNPGYESTNHTYAGGSLKVLSAVVAGIGPETPGYGTYHVLPHLGFLKEANAIVPSVKGDITVMIKKDSLFNLQLVSPVSTMAVVGIPKDEVPNRITVNGVEIWNGNYIGGIVGVTWKGEDPNYYKFNVEPGSWEFSAVIRDSDTGIITNNINLAKGKLVIASSTYEVSGWGMSKIVDGQRSTIAGVSCGWTSNNELPTNHTEWFIVDLGTAYIINKVNLYPRDDGIDAGQNFPIDFTISISNDLDNWTPVVTKTGYALPGNVTQTFSFSACNARYVKVEGTNLRPNPNDANRYRMAFAEFEVYNNGGTINENLLDIDTSHEMELMPNPFNPIININFHGWKSGSELNVLDINGKVVANLTSAVNGSLQRIGSTHVSWNALGQASGVYIIILKNGDVEFKQKVILMR